MAAQIQSEWRLYAFWVKGSMRDAQAGFPRYARGMTMAIFMLLLAVNLCCFLCFQQDKRRAVAGGRRVPERDLLMLALIGGTPAAFTARHLLRHKTRKQPFSTWLWLIAALQAAGLLAWLIL
ncbi:MAG: DUF1294 domain-containing protein [Sphingobium sp.]